MGYEATVETNIGDHLTILRPDGYFAGKSIVSFMTGFLSYCSGDDPQGEMQPWFSKLEERSREPICRIAENLSRSIYSGDWNYRDDEYEWFRHRCSLGDPTTEEQFKRTVQEIGEKWVNARSLLADVLELSGLLGAANLEATWWYDPEWTAADFQALSQTLALAVERRADQVRIRFA